MNVVRAERPSAKAGEFSWRRKVWWVLPLVVLILLLGAIYVLVHLSASDPETYPTSLRNDSYCPRLC